MIENPKVGDKVRILTQPFKFMFPIGTEGTITSIDRLDCPPITVTLPDKQRWYYEANELERV